MKKLACAILSLILCLCCAFASAEEFEIPEVPWTFPITLTDLQSEYTMLVNEDSLLDKSYEPSPLVKVTGIKRSTSSAVYLQETAFMALTDMFNAALEVTEYTYVQENGKEKLAKFSNGMRLFVESGYRSYGTQSTMYTNRLAKNNGVDDGFVAKPGASEHQSGLCADILNEEFKGRPSMTQDFKWSPEAQWMKEHCADFGFILRYPEEAEDETKIAFEPWHFRYVGKDAASYIMAEGITLEAFDVLAKEAVEDFLDRGGSIEEQLEYEFMKLNSPPMSFVLDVYGEDGDAEVTLMF